MARSFSGKAPVSGNVPVSGMAPVFTLAPSILATARKGLSLLCVVGLMGSLGGREMDPGDATVLRAMATAWSLNATAIVSCDFMSSSKLEMTCDDNGRVEQLYLAGIGINGTIPPSIGRLQSLSFLDLSDNNLSGRIPDSITNITTMTKLVLSNNQLTGGIPSSIGNLNELLDLRLSNNQLTGALPVSMANLTILQYLYLDGNKLNGSIPNMIANGNENSPFLPFLSELNLTDNYFTSYPKAWADIFFQDAVALNCILNNNNFTNQRPSAQCPGIPSLPRPLTSPPPPETPNQSSTLPGAPPPPPSPPPGAGSRAPLVVAVAVPVTAVAAMIISVALLCCVIAWRKKRKAGRHVHGEGKGGGLGEEEEEEKLSLPLYSLAQVQAITHGWREESLVGRGGYGSVYKGLDGKELVAVKRLGPCPRGPDLARREFMNEVRILSHLRHKNLVRLRGFCCQETERVVIMDYIPGGSLAHHLFQSKSSSSSRDGSPHHALSWSTRKKIALGTAEALHYLHSLSIPGTTVLHRDVKADNILLDEGANPLVCDFGLARLTHQATGKTHSETGNLRGTPGYIAPEYLVFGQISSKTDVYSFGIVLIELVTGTRRTSCCQLDPELTNLEHVLPLEAAVLACTIYPRILPKLIDPAIQAEVSVEAVLPTLHVALHCILYEPRQRPSMEAVVAMLQGQEEIPPLPEVQTAWATWSDFGSQSALGGGSSGTITNFSSNERTSIMIDM